MSREDDEFRLPAGADLQVRDLEGLPALVMPR
jgi:hypothetical protein